MKAGYYPPTKQRRVAVIGGGPAGLMAAEVAAENGAAVCVFEAQRALGRKFLIAGKSGLNLSHQSSPASFAQQYSGTDLPLTAWRLRLTRRYSPPEACGAPVWHLFLPHILPGFHFHHK